MKTTILTVMAFVLVAGTAHAASNEAPTPRNAPRTPVNRQALPERKPELPASHVLEGQLTVIDSEKIRIGDVEMRLFGVVPPQLSASYGPQARSALDTLVNNQMITCMVHDRDQAGRYLATCRTSAGNDLALELLRRGLAVTARGSLSSSDLLQPYLAAEEAAQNQKLGLWSGVVPAPALQAAPPKPALQPEVKVEATKPEVKAEAVIIPPPAPPVADTTKDTKATKPDAHTPDQVEAKTPVMPMAASSLAPNADDGFAVATSDQPNFLMRYQLLITGFIMLATALSILTVVTRQRRQEKEDELKAAAAALRGELMAARAVCQARLKTITSDADDKAATWPRIRSTLYQAYVGRLGFLGAELARQVASIYGQSSDYAAYYNAGDETRSESSPKKHALQVLIDHIEEVLPKLAAIEYTGRLAPGLAVTHVSAPMPSIPPSRPPVTIDRSASEEKLAAEEKPAAEEVTMPTTSENVSDAAPHNVVKPLWESMRKFARERFTEKAATDDGESEYESLLEDDMSNMTFGEAEDMPVTTDNVTKLTGS